MSAALIEPAVMFFKTSYGMVPDETRESNIEKAVDCSILYQKNELLTSDSKAADPLPVNKG